MAYSGMQEFNLLHWLEEHSVALYIAGAMIVLALLLGVLLLLDGRDRRKRK